MATSNESKIPAQTQGDPNVTWEDTAKHIGEDYSGGVIMVADERVDKVMISRYCEPAEIGNLTYWDEEVARMAGYRSQVVPWAMVKEVPTYSGNWRPGQPTRFPLDADVDYQSQLAARSPSSGDPPMPPTNAGFFTDMTIEFFEPVCLGDRLTTMGRTGASPFVASSAASARIRCRIGRAVRGSVGEGPPVTTRWSPSTSS